MNGPRITRFAVALALPLLLAPIAQAAESDGAARALAARIDQLLAARWHAAGVKPAARSSDAEFHRRVYLDITGNVPPVSAVRIFLADRSPDKRRVLVDRLLAGPG